MTVIGIPTRSVRMPGRTDPVWGTYASYVRALANAGAAPVLIPPGPGALAAAARCDGFVLAGGEDPARAAWWQENEQPAAPLDPQRDEVEVLVLQFARQSERPLLAICRGMQLANCAFGGTLAAVPAAVGATHLGSGDDVFHPVRVQKNSRLAGVVRDELPADPVLSRHRVQLASLGDDVHPVAWSPDGVLEAVESRGWDFLGVQWHPEMTDTSASAGLFRWLAERARARASA